MRTNQNMEVIIKLFILFHSTLHLSQCMNIEFDCNNKIFLCYNRELYYPCVQVGDNKSVVVLDLQHCPQGLECHDNADIACQRIESVENNVPDQDTTRNSRATTDKILPIIEENTNLLQNYTIPPENEVILTTTSKSDMLEMFTHDTTTTSSIQSVTKEYDVLEDSSNPTVVIGINETDSTNSKTEYSTPSTTERVQSDDETESRSTEGIDNTGQNYLSIFKENSDLDQTTEVNSMNNTLLDNNKISENNSKVSGNSGLNDRNFDLGERYPYTKEDTNYIIDSTTNFNYLIYNVIDNHVLVDRSSEENDDDSLTLQPTTTEYIQKEDTTEPTTYQNLSQTEAEEDANLIKLTQQGTVTSIETVSDDTEVTIRNRDATEAIMKYGYENESEQPTIVNAIKPITENSMFNDGESDEDLDERQANFKPTLQSTTTESISNRNEIRTELIIGTVTFVPTTENSVSQRESEEIANFFKLTQQVTTVTVGNAEIRYLTDQTEASTLNYRSIDSDATEVTTEYINNENDVETAKPTIQSNRFERGPLQDLDKIQDMFKPAHSFTLLINQPLQFIITDETTIKPINNRNENLTGLIFEQATDSEIELASRANVFMFNDAQVNGGVIQMTTPEELHKTTLSANEQFRFINNIESVETAIGNVTLEPPPITSNDRFHRESEEDMTKDQRFESILQIQDVLAVTNPKIPEPAIGVAITINPKTEYQDTVTQMVNHRDPEIIRTNQSSESSIAKEKLAGITIKENSSEAIESIGNKKEGTIENPLEQIPNGDTMRPITVADKHQKESDNDENKNVAVQIIITERISGGVATNYSNQDVSTTTQNSSDIEVSNPSKLEIINHTDLNAEYSIIVETIRAPDATIHKDGIKKDIDKNTEDSLSNLPNILKTDFDCKIAGQFPDPNNSSIYHVCMDIYIKILHFPAVCPPGTLYDSNLQNCTRRPVECSEDNTLQCTRSGVFAHPTDCNRYYKCFWRSLHKKFSLWQFKCPSRMRYDQERRKCVNAAASTLDCGGLSQDSTESPFYCVENGRFPMEYNCDGYYDCKEKKGAFQTKEKFCSPGKLFDRELGRCRRSDLVFCPYEYDNIVDGDGNNSV